MDKPAAGKRTYRGVEFEFTTTGIWMFTDYLPSSASHWNSWSRFFTPEEQRNVTEEAMKRAIDRAYANTPIHTGDLRDQSC
jgi:hypothetical protein